MEHYINPYTDFGFKKLFGEEANKVFLIDFLNTLLPPEHQIATLAFHNPERRGAVPDEALMFYDIHCKNEKGEPFIVEMQRTSQNFFINRALYYVCDVIRSQDPRPAGSSEADAYKLTPVYFIGVLNFRYDLLTGNRGKAFHESLLVRNIDLRDQNGELACNLVRFTLVQMPVFTKTESELETHQDKWLYFLKNLPTFKSIPAILKEPIFQKAFREAELVSMTTEERETYQRSYRNLIDREAVMGSAIEKAEQKGIAKGIAKGRAQGIAEGIAKGRAEGEHAKTLEIARGLKAAGISLEIIAKTTSLPFTEIQNL